MPIVSDASWYASIGPPAAISPMTGSDVRLHRGRLRDELRGEAEAERRVRREPDRPRLRRAALEVALALEDQEVVVDGRRRREADRLRDLADRRRIAPGAQRRGDEVEDLDLPVRVVLGHPAPPCGGMIPNGRSMSRLAAEGDAGSARARTDRLGRPGDARGAVRPAVTRSIQGDGRRVARSEAERPQTAPARAGPARSRRSGSWRSCRSPAAPRIYARLIFALLLDERTPASRKALLAGAAGYLLVGRDIIPDEIPILGGLDDLVVVVLAVDLFLDGVPEPSCSHEKLDELGIDRVGVRPGHRPRSGG